MGKLYAVGFGPGGYEHMTAKAIDVIKNADIITGYTKNFKLTLVLLVILLHLRHSLDAPSAPTAISSTV